jgi:ribose-phosphate pyrophosphokinase
MSRLLVEKGIQEIWVACTHGVIVRGGWERLASILQVTEIVTTDTVYIPPEIRSTKLQILCVAPIFGEAFRRNFLRQSLGDLFVFSDSQ